MLFFSFFLFFFTRPPSLLHPPPPTPFSCPCVINCCICSDFTCMWPLHLPVNNHTLQHGYWFVTLKTPPAPFASIHWLSRNIRTNRKWDRHLEHSSQCMVGIKSDCVQVWRNSILLLHTCHNTPPPPQTHPSHPPFLRQGDLCLLTCVCVCVCVCVYVCVCLCVSMAVTALGRRRTSSGSWMLSRPSSGTYTGQRRSLPNTSRVAYSSCRATWSRTVSNGVFCVRLFARGEPKKNKKNKYLGALNAENTLLKCL